MWGLRLEDIVVLLTVVAAVTLWYFLFTQPLQEQPPTFWPWSLF